MTSLLASYAPLVMEEIPFPVSPSSIAYALSVALAGFLLAILGILLAFYFFARRLGYAGLKFGMGPLSSSSRRFNPNQVNKPAPSPPGPPPMPPPGGGVW